MKRTIGLAVAFLTLSSLALAQEHATLVLRSGQHIRGQLIELSGLDFTVAVGGVEQLVPTRDVAVIEFAGGDMQDADWAGIPDRQQAVWLKSGAIVTGQLYDISGTSPLKITFQTPGGTRQFSSAEIQRIVLARPTSPTGTSAKHRPAPDLPPPRRRFGETRRSPGEGGRVGRGHASWRPDKLHGSADG